MISSQPEQTIKAQLALLLFEKNFITKDEYDIMLLNNHLDDAVIADMIGYIYFYLSDSSENISKKDIFNILKFIKNPDSFGSYPVQLITESIIYKTNNKLNSESKIKKINEMLSEAPNLLALYDVWETGSRNDYPNREKNFKDRYKLNQDLLFAISQKNAECARAPNHPNNFKIICDYSTSSGNIALTITNNDNIGSIPGKSFIQIFSLVNNAILTKNKITTRLDSSSQGNFTENKVKYILLMMNELDRFNFLKDMSDQDKEIFAKFFKKLPSIDPSQLTSINQTFKKLYDDQVSSPELKFKQLVMHLNSLFNRDMSISLSNITSPATDAVQRPHFSNIKSLISHE